MIFKYLILEIFYSLYLHSRNKARKKKPDSCDSDMYDIHYTQTHHTVDLLYAF